MSSCRMCDNCGTVFSERAENWSSGSLTVMKTNLETGSQEPTSLQIDKCPECTEASVNPPPRPMLPGGTRGEYLT